MLKRISLVFMLLTALFGIVGVQAQVTAVPQSMAKYLPAETDVFFALRTDEAFLDELSGLISMIVQKLPDDISSQLISLDLKFLLEYQVGPIAELGIGDYAAVGVGNTEVLYDQDFTNDDQVIIYAAVTLADAAKFETFFERMMPNMAKTDEQGVTVYSAEGQMSGKVFVTDEVAYFTIHDTLPAGEMLDSSDTFNETINKLPEPGYNFVFYADSTTMFQMPPQQLEMMSELGLDVTSFGPIAVGGTILDDKSLVIDAYTPSLGAVMPATAPVDPAFAGLIPSDASYVIQGTDLKLSMNAIIDLLYQVNDMQTSSTLPSRPEINAQLQAFLGIDLDNDIIGWMGGNYALIGDANVKSIISASGRGPLDTTTLDPHFALIIEGDGSDKPAKLAEALGKLLVTQSENDPSAPVVRLSTTEELTSVIIEDIPLQESPEMTITIEIAGNADVLLLGDQTTVDAILSGEGDHLSDEASFIEAQTYMLPNASMIAFADGEGWGNVLSLGIMSMVVAPAVFDNVVAGLNAEADGSPTPTPVPTEGMLAPVVPLMESAYEFVSSSSISIAYLEDGSQLSRVVLTLK